MGVASWTPRAFVTRFVIGFLSLFVICLLLFLQVPQTVQLVGYTAMAVESALVIPQLLLNRSRRSCEGLALSLVGNWILGDVLKTIYFVVLSQPMPFLACAFAQLSLDGVLVYQLIAYRTPQGPNSNRATPAPSPVTAVALSSRSHRQKHCALPTPPPAALSPSVSEGQPVIVAPVQDPVDKDAPPPSHRVVVVDSTPLMVAPGTTRHSQLPTGHRVTPHELRRTGRQPLLGSPHKRQSGVTESDDDLGFAV